MHNYFSGKTPRQPELPGVRASAGSFLLRQVRDIEGAAKLSCGVASPIGF